MATDSNVKGTIQSDGRRGRGPTKAYPSYSFREAFVIAETIHEHGFGGEELRRLSVFSRLGRSANSNESRYLVTAAAKYGLTTGSHSSEELKLTAEGKQLFDPHLSTRERRRLEFDLAVAGIEIFRQLYERLKRARVPALDVLKSGLPNLPEQQRDECARVFLENARQLGLIQSSGNVERLAAIEDVITDLREETEGKGAVPSLASQAGGSGPVQVPSAAPMPILAPVPGTPRAPQMPSVHIDVNIHIDSTASPEQIDAIFAGMARHLYHRDDN